MARDLPIGNGDMLVTFDRRYRIRDLYYPYVGHFNHTLGHEQNFGVWVDGEYAWVHDDSWTRSMRYVPDTLVTHVTLRNERLGLEIVCNDCVDFHEPALIRKATVRDLRGAARTVRLFYHYDLSVAENPVGDTANYDPDTSGLVLYKGDHYFMVNGIDCNRAGIDAWAIGTKRFGGAEGTWRDAEDGVLGRNAIAQGSVDATVGFEAKLEPNGTGTIWTWLACGKTYDDARRISRSIVDRTPALFQARTDAYWRLWVRRTSELNGTLPPEVVELYYRSLLILRTQIDNRGAIIAANDTDITHFAGDHYSYCWPRDGALVAYALVMARQAELSRAFFRFCGRAVHRNGYFLHKYTPAGQLASSWHPWTIGGERVLPVQQDETALVLWSLRKHFDQFHDVEFIKPLYVPLVISPAMWMLRHRDDNGLPSPSWDLWEERRGIHTFTVAATIGALQAASLFAADFADIERAGLFEEGAQRMLAALRAHLWNPAENRFARMATPKPEGGYTLDMTHDSANYALFAFEALGPDDPMVLAEMAAMVDRLGVKTAVGGVARYTNDYYHQVDRTDTGKVPGNPWIICTLWRAQHAIALAKTFKDLEPALEIMKWTAARALESGVLAEQLDPHTGAPLSVSPLTWSHATFVTVVLEYLQKREQLTRDAVRRAAASRSEPLL
jgi:GH15 family glucan-1,4-alpha-glucosidase